MGRWILRGIAALLTVAVLAGAAAVFLWSQFTKPGPLRQPATVVIERGSGLGVVADSLEYSGVIASGDIFMAVVRALGEGGRLKAGEYSFAPRVSMKAVMEKLIRGETVVHRLTVPEGLTSAQVVALLKATPELSGTIEDVPPEGSLLPETYHFSRGDSRAEIIARMQRAMRQTLAELWPERASGLALDSPEEAVVLASIVERETAVPEERPRVAAVFHNRLRKGMRLQSDPTVIYGLSDGEGVIDRALTRADLRRDHPFNTYVHGGLPPAPISNPGRAAIAAVLNPADSEDLYFVADGNGGHAFARTLEEHNRNVRRWRKLRDQR